MAIAEYIENINRRFKTSISREHSYRGDLQSLVESLAQGVIATNEPARIDCGAPDFIITKKNIPVGYIEAKDIGKPLDGKEFKEQFDRYKKSLKNLIFTDYLDFWLYHEGEFVTSIRIAKIEGTNIKPLTENFAPFTNLITNFCTYTGQTIKSSQKLAGMMAGKARMLADVIEKAITSDEKTDENSTLQEQMNAFKDVLIHDIKPKEFADIYSQTIAYGMFAGRFHDKTLEDFSRQEAAELIPKSNPFLRKLFGYIAGPDIDDRIKWLVDELADVFLAADVKTLLKDFGKATQQNDPIIHFYETFLAEYDPKLRKSRGVFYTPAPVVNFIVRAVDDILKTEFALPDGLADNSKTKIKVKVPTHDSRYKQGLIETEQEVHKVQILDPATGTGTFLAETVKHIYKKFETQQGIWSQYVDNHLIPRLNGFEILMASYAMAHLKLDLLLQETGYEPQKQQRLKVYLTNTLEEYHKDTGTLFANWLSNEANEANHIKRDTPVMVVLGNPPYSGISTNKGEWITNLIEDYKYVDGEHFGERKHWLQDDYVKFIRYGQFFVDKNGEGILAYISNHGFLDNPTFRGMRWNLLQSFDKIYILDLHGNTMKKEVNPTNVPDKNVFDIQQGVSINIFIKHKFSNGNKTAIVKHKDLWGSRDIKYKFLWDNSLISTNFNEIKPIEPYYFFTDVSYQGDAMYQTGFSLDKIFIEKVTGIVTARDNLVINIDRKQLIDNITHFCDENYSDNQIRTHFFGHKKETKYLQGDSRGWKLKIARINIRQNSHNENIKHIEYRPFDIRYIYYSAEMVDWGREKQTQNIIDRENTVLVFPRQAVTNNWSHVQITKSIVDNRFHYSNKGIPMFSPLYLYPDTNNQQTTEKTTERTPNLNNEIVNQIAEKLGLTFTNEKDISASSTSENTFAPIDILDYIYAVLHSPTYREKYKEFLKIDFPRVPYPKDKETFWQLAKLGGEIRQIHLLESPKVSQSITSYPQNGDNIITRRIGKKDFQITNKENNTGRVWLNEQQYFENVPLIAWEFYIGGYQPAQKWLKDHHNRQLSFDDILHYQKIIVALTETDRIMKEIDKIEL